MNLANVFVAVAGALGFAFGTWITVNVFHCNHWCVTRRWFLACGIFGIVFCLFPIPLVVDLFGHHVPFLHQLKGLLAYGLCFCGGLVAPFVYWMMREESMSRARARQGHPLAPLAAGEASGDIDG